MPYLLSLLALLIVLSSPNQTRAGEVPGVSDDKILVGMTTDLTGPVAFIGQQIRAGAMLYLRHLNEEGGVHGRQIELRVEDDSSLRSWTVLRACSIGVVTSVSRSSALAPIQFISTNTIGRDMGGSSCDGITRIAQMPARVIMIMARLAATLCLANNSINCVPLSCSC